MALDIDVNTTADPAEVTITNPDETSKDVWITTPTGTDIVEETSNGVKRYKLRIPAPE